MKQSAAVGRVRVLAGALDLRAELEIVGAVSVATLRGVIQYVTLKAIVVALCDLTLSHASSPRLVHTRCSVEILVCVRLARVSPRLLFPVDLFRAISRSSFFPSVFFGHFCATLTWHA